MKFVVVKEPRFKHRINLFSTACRASSRKIVGNWLLHEYKDDCKDDIKKNVHKVKCHLFINVFINELELLSFTKTQQHNQLVETMPLYYVLAKGTAVTSMTYNFLCCKTSE